MLKLAYFPCVSPARAWPRGLKPFQSLVFCDLVPTGIAATNLTLSEQAFRSAFWSNCGTSTARNCPPLDATGALGFSPSKLSRRRPCLPASSGTMDKGEPSSKVLEGLPRAALSSSDAPSAEPKVEGLKFDHQEGGSGPKHEDMNSDVGKFEIGKSKLVDDTKGPDHGKFLKMDFGSGAKFDIVGKSEVGKSEIVVDSKGPDHGKFLKMEIGSGAKIGVVGKSEIAKLETVDTGHGKLKFEVDENVKGSALGKFKVGKLSEGDFQKGDAAIKFEKSVGTGPKQEGQSSESKSGAFLRNVFASGQPSPSTGEPAGTVFLLAKTMKEAFDAENFVCARPPGQFPEHLRLEFGGEIVGGSGEGIGGGAETQGEGEERSPLEDWPEFHGANYLELVESKELGRVVLVGKRVPSTHTLLAKNFSSFPVGTLCVADTQNQGKGRGGNTWESPVGCLLFSFTLQSSDGRKLPFLQYVVCLALVQAIEVISFGRGEANKPLPVRIKWPNDLYANGLKIGGILCTSTFSNKMFNIVVGVGLNVSNTQPTTCLNALLEEQNPEYQPITREEILAAFMTRFEELYTSFNEKGFAELEQPYLQRWLHTDQRVVLVECGEGEDETAAESQVYLTVKGLTSGGYLLAVDDSGESFELHPDGNR
eukprot:TRINITY_DN21189_c0_g1_i1.p1 TRINITY_DN21189_c0_g1~~TRINITY_DN21189_c0_g1_i1.p1  ORF type:complete len:649 (+),score=111.23 TRINITY_DN21189_c0_g1_i1:363-2309(+)